MATIVNYSDSEADASDNGGCVKDDCLPLPASSATVKKDALSPIHQDSDDDNLATEKLLLNEKTEETVEVPSCSKCNDSSDFFGIDNSSDSSESDEDSYFAKGNNVWAKPITASTAAARLGGSANILCKNKTSHLGDRKVKHVASEGFETTKCQLSDAPQSEFWKSNQNCDWNKPDEIWGMGVKQTSKQDADTLDQEVGLNTSAYISKKRKSDDTDGVIFETSIPSPLKKSCYFVHHNISPGLHKPVGCRAPGRRYIQLKGHSGAINRLKWCKQEFSHLLASTSMDNTVKIWNVFSTVSNCVQTFACHSKAVKDVCWSDTGREIVSCGYDRAARLLDVEQGKQIRSFEHQEFLTCLKYHPVNPNYVLLGSKNSVISWDKRTSSSVKLYTYKHTFGQVQDIVFINDGREFVSSTDCLTRDSTDRSLMVFDFASGVVLSNQVYQELYVCPRLDVHPHTSEMIAQSNANSIMLFSTIRPYKMNKHKKLEGHMVFGYSVGCGYSPDGRYVTSGSAKGGVFVWDHQRALLLRKLGDPREIYLDVAWHPLLGSTIASSTWSGSIDVWQ